MRAVPRRILLAGLGLVAGLALIATLAATGVLDPGRPGAGPGIGGPFALTDMNGRPATQAMLDGHPTLVFFGYTHCPDVCPTTLFDMSEVFKALGPAAAVQGLFVTVDPERDTAPVMKAYLDSFDPRITGLTGPRAALDAMLREYRVYSKKVPAEGGDPTAYTMDHTALVYLLDVRGRFVNAFNLDRAPAEAAAELKSYL